MECGVRISREFCGCAFQTESNAEAKPPWRRGREEQGGCESNRFCRICLSELSAAGGTGPIRLASDDLFVLLIEAVGVGALDVNLLVGFGLVLFGILFPVE